MNIPTQKKEAKRTPAFRDWFDGMKDRLARTIIAARVERVQMGLYGDVEPVGAGVSTLRIDYGPGLRVYFSETLDNSIILLLVGGDKSHQSPDIKHAQQMLATLKQQRDTLNKSPAPGSKIKEKSA